eukprot:CAMPEP_0184360388 /NCGR_PEP_ID=MMETSP1089-20130417/124759_1 /TAXON_ID=38269 ORGANISM="Gloeochaete wittrockiana, Strain SAG46.84" /NCGR_SAMPLE_ID=MMETSP1089 /ASSEMBLY_ACC=CAM_ASM_000445 /LENGTH=42 /DNA_ID= /DNA_START= /DNA_END= /DNA_ORIENTATION=
MTTAFAFALLPFLCERSSAKTSGDEAPSASGTLSASASVLRS